MSFIKLGELVDISLETSESVIPMIDDSAITEHFKRYAFEMKKIAPKANDFLYFSAVMMHSAEASAINPDGSVKKTANGEPVTVGWDTSGGTWRWITNDPSVKPYKNSNNDIFPESELIKAYRKWKDKPLCIDHKSDSVDYVRGFIVDTYYDRALKRVVALCALDKFNYPDLARKVSSRYSNSVSMGTAVGRAICFDCGQVARAEKDFCQHMRSKTSYGEINVDLSPIELSIVVNGADQYAKIKHIIASANELNRYVEMKRERMEEISKSSVKIDDIIQIRKEFDDAMTKLANLESAIIEEKSAKNTNDTALVQASGDISVAETELPATDFNISPPAQRLAADDDCCGVDIVKLNEVVSSIESNLTFIKQSLDKLSNSNNTNEENMSGSKDNVKQAYFQGTEEPTPGEAKYLKEPLNENLRTDGDKHMMAQDTGPVDGLFPGDLEKKKMLARAQAEERAMRRQTVVAKAKEALEKRSYFQGTEEPTPGKPQYSKDPMNQDLREDSDKQMVGAKPFPGVGKTEDLYPEDKKKKELLQRASFRARFIKAANNDGTHNKGNSAWEVYSGDKLLVSASVNELTGNRANALYAAIATKDFGAKLIEDVKTVGAAKVKSLYKSAQEAAVAEPAPEAPAPEAPAPEAPAVEAAPVPADNDGLKETVVDLKDKLKEVSSDLGEALDKLLDEQAEMGDMDKAASQESASLNNMRKELNGALVNALKESIAELKDREEELTQIADLSNKNEKLASENDMFKSIVEDSIEEAKTVLADSFKLMTAFVKYARGTEAIVKRAEIESKLTQLSDNGESDMAALDDLMNDDKDLMNLINDVDDDMNALKEEMCAEDDSSDSATADDVDTDMVAEASFNLTTKEGRTAFRAKLAADTMKMSPVLHEAHPKGGTTTSLDVKPSGNLAEVEDLEGVHDAMMDVATAPPKVRKEAEAIQSLIVSGQLDAADVDALVSEGLDKDAVAYWKKYFGQAGSEGSQFATELVKEHAKAKMEKELDAFKVKIARAYELTYDMVERGLCSRDRSSVSSQVEEILKSNNDGFDSLKRVVARHEPLAVKQSGRMPQVGIIGSEESFVSLGDSENLLSQLSAAFSGNGKRLF